MALNLADLSPAESDWTPAPRGRQAIDKGPNPFLTEGWLKRTFDNGKAEKVTVAGHWEEVQATVNQDGKRVPKFDASGQPVMKQALKGDAADVVSMIRDAADAMKIGATINPVKGRRNGTVTIHYLGIKRRKTTPKES